MPKVKLQYIFDHDVARRLGLPNTRDVDALVRRGLLKPLSINDLKAMGHLSASRPSDKLLFFDSREVEAAKKHLS